MSSRSIHSDKPVKTMEILPIKTWLWMGSAIAVICASAPAQAAAPVKCHSSATYLVIARDRPEVAGTDFIVKAKADPTVKIACAYKPSKTDFKIGGPDDAYYFLALKGSMLALDGGTGPIRELVVFDLDTRKKVLEATTSGEDAEVTDQGITFWMQTEEGTEANCKEFKEYSAKDLGAMIETRSTFNFASATLTKSQQTRCTATQ